ncbi:MAG: MBOAT family protein [Geminicoccaceae bacterium]|nr:MBOAT family protein [Geminicoccaceae bacterium]
MLFHALGFMLLFLPVVLAGHAWMARWRGVSASLAWLIGASLFFYGWWYPPHLLLLLFSVSVNFLLGERLARKPSQVVLWFGIGFNLVLIGLFKYADFAVLTLDALAGSAVVPPSLLLPLAISFFTFQQIAFLVDVHAGRIRPCGPMRYLFFVSFFPQLVAGPIVHHRQLVPQIDPGLGTVRARALALGLAVFVVGLVKKVMIADPLGAFADPMFAQALEANGGSGAPIGPGLIEAWGGTTAFTFQLYFDFSGYSDMAVGLAMMFGIRLPFNFDAPYRASGIVDFWRRWHMTLSAFLRDHLYVPLGGSRQAWPGWAAALMTTMVLGGLWHGAAWTFVAWGALHGLLLLIAHGWRHLVHRRRSSLRPVAGSGEARARRWSRPIAHVAGVALTFACVHLAWVLFRAESFAAALSVYGGMLGLNGVRLPEYYLDMLGSWGPILQARGVSFAPLRDFAFGGMEQIAITALAALLVFFAPTTQRLFGLAGDPCGSSSTTSAPGIVRPNFSWGLTTGVALAVVISTLLSDPPDVFIYFQF